jgi:hypothetical protein
MGWQLPICQRVRRKLQKHLYFFLPHQNSATKKVNLSYLLRVKTLLKYLSFLWNYLSFVAIFFRQFKTLSYLTASSTEFLLQYMINEYQNNINHYFYGII